MSGYRTHQPGRAGAPLAARPESRCQERQRLARDQRDPAPLNRQPGLSEPAAPPAAAPPAAGRNGQIRVLLADHHMVVRAGLRAFLAGAPEVDVVAEAADGEATVRAIADLEAAGSTPDVALVDLHMPRLDGVATTRIITERFPVVRVVILSGSCETDMAQAALAAGAAGFLLKDATPEEITVAVRAAAAGEVYLDPSLARRLTQRLAGPSARPAGLSALTPRERDILARLAGGNSNRQIADALYISERTVRTHVSNILAKMHLSSRTQAVLAAIGNGLVPVPGAS